MCCASIIQSMKDLQCDHIHVQIINCHMMEKSFPKSIVVSINNVVSKIIWLCEESNIDNIWFFFKIFSSFTFLHVNTRRFLFTMSSIRSYHCILQKQNIQTAGVT